MWRSIWFYIKCLYPFRPNKGAFTLKNLQKGSIHITFRVAEWVTLLRLLSYWYLCRSWSPLSISIKINTKIIMWRHYDIIYVRTRAVASLSLPGGQDTNMSSILPHFPVGSPIFPQFFFIFFLILVFCVGGSPTREGPGYATGQNGKKPGKWRNLFLITTFWEHTNFTLAVAAVFFFFFFLMNI